MSSPLSEAETDASERPPSVLWRMASVPVIGYAIVALLALISYDATDIPSLSTSAAGTFRNWMGGFGAYNAYALYRLLGLAAPLVPLFTLLAGSLLLGGRRLGARLAGMAAFALSTGALLQFAGAPLASLLKNERLNLAPHPGGALGALLSDQTLTPWIGTGGTVAIHAVILIAASLVIIGPMTIMRYFYTLRARDIAVRRTLEDGLDPDEDPAEARRRERENARARLMEEKMAAREARLLKRTMREDAREAEKARKLAQREAAKAATGTDRVPPPSPPHPTPPRTLATPVTQAAAPTTPFVANEVAFKLPSTRLLQPPAPVAKGGDENEVAENTALIEGTLAEFGINVRVTSVVRGPVITCYEIKPPPGVRVDKIATYSSNLQMVLQANSLRILSPIPGKNVMGIEIPNNIRQTVSIREVAEKPEWKHASKKMALPMLLGMDISGSPVIADLARMPHILIAGTTGSGKSVCLNSILAGFMLSRTPDDLRLLMVDPKMVEFTPYAGLPHLVVPIITAPKKVAAALQWAIIEMKRRLELFKRVGVKNILTYNNRDRRRDDAILAEIDTDSLQYAHQPNLIEDPADEPVFPEKLPYIVIVIDEMADLMMTAQNEVQPRIVTLAQLSRAVGIHMILATQRPSVNVITGLIKANFPARVAFKVSQRVDSQTILDAKGAEHLIGMGDMLFSNPDGGTITRAQGTWIDEDEVGELVDWFKKQGEPVYVDEIKNRLDRIVIKQPQEDFGEETDAEAETDAAGDEDADADAELLVKALACIVVTRRASTSAIQRALRIGYNRAARVMDELERRGCIGPANGAAPREILRTTLDEDAATDPADDDH